MSEVSETTVRREAEGFDPLSFRVPEWHIYEGMMLTGTIPLARIQQVQQMRYLPDDVFVASFPKAGTTLTQEIVYLVRHDGDVEKANKEFTHIRVPYVELAYSKDPNHLEEVVSKLEHPRTLKTHLPFKIVKDIFLDQKINVVYVMRNPKDTLVSLFYFYKMCINLGNFPGTWNDFFEMVMADLDSVLYGSMFRHYAGWWRHRHLPNMLIMKYEDMVRNPKPELARIARFCGKPDLSDEIITKIADATSFDVMKANPKTNFANAENFKNEISMFMRKGKIGDWKNHFTVAQSEMFDDVIKREWDGTGLEFEYE